MQQIPFVALIQSLRGDVSVRHPFTRPDSGESELRSILPTKPHLRLLSASRNDSRTGPSGSAFYRVMKIVAQATADGYAPGDSHFAMRYPTRGSLRVYSLRCRERHYLVIDMGLYITVMTCAT